MRKILLGLLAAAVLIPLGYVLFGPLGGEQRDSGRGADAPAVEAGDEASRDPAELEDLSGGEQPAADSQVSAPALATRGVAGEFTGEADGEFVRGRVSLPAGIPADEVATVALFENYPGPWGDEPVLVEVEWDAVGHFELPWPVDAERVWIQIRARYLVLLEPLEVQAEDNAYLELAPELGIWVRGAVALPEGAGVELLGEDFEVQLSPDPGAYLGTGAIEASKRMTRREVEPDLESDAAAGGRVEFEFTGVTVGIGFELRCSPALLAAVRSEMHAPTAGARIDVLLEPLPGIALVGRVVDEQGQGVAGAELEVSRDPLMFGQGGFEVRDGESGPDGAFELPALLRGPVELKVEAEGFLGRNTQVELLSDAQSVEVVLERGNTLAGTVLFADGSPAAGAVVDVEFDTSFLGGMEAFNAMRGADGSAEADSEGRFEVLGLGSGPFEVKARADFEADEGRSQFARVDGVRPGTGELELRLERMRGVRGRVFDDTGAPMTAFRVEARTQSSGMMAGMGGERVSDEFESETGEFFLEGLISGSWSLSASAEDHVPGEAVELELGADAVDDLVLVAERAATVRGTVVDEYGAPVEGARVARVLQLANMTAMDFSGQATEARTDAEGRFDLSGLAPGSVEISATATGQAESAALSLELSPAEVLEGQLLALRNGGRLRGKVFGKDGKGAAGSRVLAQDPTRPNSQAWSETDSDGEFFIEHLIPGQLQVIAFESSGGSPVSGDGEADMASVLGAMKFAFVDIVEGEEAYVELGAAPADPVQVSGRVLLAGEPVADAMVSFVADQAASESPSAGSDSLRFATTDDAGGFKVELNGPGEYLLSVQQVLGTGHQQTVEFAREVPTGESYEILLELPGSGIAGRVFGPDGEPAGGARISLGVDGPQRAGSMTGGQYAEIQTDDDGRYALRWLRPGRYTVSAGGALLGGLFGGSDESALGRQTRVGLELGEDTWLEDIDFRLERPGRIAGRVIDVGGKPVADAAIFMHDADGHPLERISMLKSDGSGRFEIGGLEAGTYRVDARVGDRVSHQPAAVTVEVGETAEVTVGIDAGTIIEITLSDREGEPIDCSLSVTDSEGTQVHGLLSLDDLMQAMASGGFSSRVRRIGPLPPGAYRVEASADDGRSAKKTVQLTGQEVRRVKLRLD